MLAKLRKGYVPCVVKCTTCNVRTRLVRIKEAKQGDVLVRRGAFIPAIRPDQLLLVMCKHMSLWARVRNTWFECDAACHGSGDSMSPSALQTQ